MIASLPLEQAKPVGATAWTAAYDEWHDRYQAYYLAGLRMALRERSIPLDIRPLHRFPRLLRGLRTLRCSHRLGASFFNQTVGPMIDRVAQRIAGCRLPTSGQFFPLIGQYEFTFKKRPLVRLAIDAADAGEMMPGPFADQCAVYAKANYRPTLEYPPQVVPLCNGNPFILPSLNTLTDLRSQQPRYDLCFVVRVWGGRDETEGVEHNLRLLEAVNRASCRKFLLAYLVAGDLDQQEKRLRAQGIPTTRRPMPLRQLWQTSAAARINVIRLGMHNCIPWRYMDLLAMGACVLFDQVPQTVWQPPLIPGEHFLHLGVETTPDQPLGTANAYEAIPGKVEEALRNTPLIRHVQARAADYFDCHACPEAVGRQLLTYVARAAESIG